MPVLRLQQNYMRNQSHKDSWKNTQRLEERTYGSKKNILGKF